MTDSEKNKQQGSPLGWLLAHAGSGRGKFIASTVLAAAGVACQIVPYLCAAGMITALMAGDRKIDTYLPLFVWMCVFWILRVLLHYISTTLSHRATFEALGNIKRLCLEKLARMPLGAVQDTPSGTWKNIIMERVDSTETILAHILPEFTSNILGSLILFVMILVLDWRMALVSLIVLPVGMLLFMGMFLGYQENYDRTVRATGELNNVSVEYINGIEVIKVFGRVRGAYERFAAAAKENAESYISWMRKSNFFFCFSYNVMPATLLTVLPIGCLFVKNGSLSADAFVTVILLSAAMITPIITCLSYTDDMAVMGTVVGQVQELLEAPEMERPSEPVKEGEARGDSEPTRADAAQKDAAAYDIRLRNVHFRYKEEEVLHGIDMEIPQGSFTALVGPSGSGKSTIARLIASLWDVTDGQITIGGRDIREIPAGICADMISYVSQDNYLFDMSVRENIRLGRSDATNEDVEEAARACGCHDFILQLEHGYDTVAGSFGGHLSGGEKQRICIARAMLKGAPIIILDEATAYTDPENEALIQASVAKLVKGKTLIVIAHRLSTVQDADRIYVIEDGSIAASGTHRQLLEDSPLYRTMWEAHISVKDHSGEGSDSKVNDGETNDSEADDSEGRAKA